MAFKEQEEILHLLKEYDFYAQTTNSITEKQAYLAELETVRQLGYSIDNEENEPGIYCIAVPIFDHTNKAIAAISISATKQTITRELEQEVVSKLKHTCTEISKALGNKKVYL
ncbi:transcriptional regulator [Gracilibacillus boraciitolerans JCM 21714]|uniref:Transcriptional regulator n=1 Tax=Gracilibacillus boraciitolerans JCM 21714 TaxID=1298598 RepID=W4VGR5_9BACI|nr:transcriptional regulator [Gracilibacillus boraciitolerans JCM 21714]